MTAHKDPNEHKFIRRRLKKRPTMDSNFTKCRRNTSYTMFIITILFCEFTSVLSSSIKKETNSGLRIYLANKELKELNKVSDEEIRTRRSADETKAMHYLSTYGYTKPSALSADGSIQGQASISRALEDMQSFLNIPITGELDEITLKTMSLPRCGNPDKEGVLGNIFRRKKRYTTVGFKWKQLHLTYAYTNYTPKIGKKGTESAIDSAFAVWASHAPLEFRKVDINDNPDIVILFAKGFHDDNTAFDGEGGYLAHAFYPGPKIGGDTHFDLEEPWIVNSGPNDRGNDLFLVAVHELGHALGLGHSPEPNAIMAPVYQYHDTANFRLPQDDINGIQNLYGVRDREPEKPIVPIATTTSTTPKTTTSTTKRTTTTTRSHWRPEPTKYPHRTTSRSVQILPELCKLKKYDAIAYLRNELYIFSGKYLWRKRGNALPSGPYKIASFWPLLSFGVDAVFENPIDYSISFFKGTEYYKYDTITLLSGYPRKFQNLGLYTPKVNTAVWWERNGKIYIFKDEEYWRMSDVNVDDGYPKDINVWKGIPSAIDAAFIANGEEGRNITYFVKGDKYWKFSNWEIQAISEGESFSQDWLGCDENGGYDRDVVVTKNEGVSTVLIVCISIAIILMVIAALLYFMHTRRQRQRIIKAATVVHEALPAYSGGYRTNFEDPPTDDKPSKRLLAKTMIEHQLNNIRFSLQHKV